MPKPISGLALALVWLTRLPVGGLLPANPPTLSQVAWAFPLVGLILGAAAGAVLGLAHWLGLGAAISALLAIATLVWLTGGLHEDGLADLADGMGGRTTERRLEIMRDSRIGSYGALTLGLVTALRVCSVAALPIGAAVAALIVAGGASRAAMVIAMRQLPPARPDGLGKSAGRPSLAGAALAVALALGLAGLVLLIDARQGAWALVLAAALGAAVQIYIQNLARKRLGGLTGDVLGAVQQGTECAFLVAFAAAFAEKL